MKASYLTSGLTTRVHGNCRRKPKHALAIEEIKSLVTFLNNYDEKNAILLPGRIPGYKCDTIQLLPSSSTKKVHIHTYIHSLVTQAYTHTHPPNIRTYMHTHYKYTLRRTYTRMYTSILTADKISTVWWTELHNVVQQLLLHGGQMMGGRSVVVGFQFLSCIRFISLWAGHGVWQSHGLVRCEWKSNDAWPLSLCLYGESKNSAQS